MELADILALAKAGYSREEIAQMGAIAQMKTEHAPADEPVPASEPVPEPVPQQQQTPAPVQETQPKEPTMQELMQSIAKLTSAVQANAIAQSVIPAGISNPPKAEDMLAEIIRPTFKERG